jgi:pyruvate/2-oxoglutarate dehydrogenase complex dihydrolipoamide acyltransferase (E2) component
VPTEFPLPDVGEGLAEAEIVRWLVAPGDTVREDDAFVEIETDKALVQITSPVTGTLTSQAAAEGDVVAVGSLLAVFEADGSEPSVGDGSDDAAAAVPTTDAPAAAATPDAAAVGTSTPARSRKAKATPATRKLARRLDVDIATVTGTGAGGRVLDEDVQRAAGAGPTTDAAAGGGSSSVSPDQTPAAPPAPSEAPPRPTTAAPDGQDERLPLRGLRRAVARTMTTSWTTVPHVNSIHEVDLHELMLLRSRLTDQGRAIPVTAFMVKAAALALREFPVLNAQVDADAEEIVLKHRCNLGVAVDAPDGLIVPVIDDADRKPVAAIGVELRTLAEQARDRSLPQERLRGGTFTVNNYGPLGGWFGTSLVKPPEVGILSFGPAREQVVPRDGEIVIRPMGVMALAADHRVADGRELIGFCLAVRNRLEAPLQLLVEE